jgi:outer membrane lipoprotein carrier protein
MRISDSLGQDTTVSFDSVQVNRDIPVEEFKAVLPEGTDVIRDLPLANGS